MVSIFASTFDLPLKVSRLVFSSLLGVLGSVVGGVIAYLLSDIEIMGMNISMLTIIILSAIVITLHRKQLERLYNVITRGGEKYVGWQV